MDEPANQAPPSPSGSVQQHTIPDPAPIQGWEMTQGSPGAWTYELVGRTVITSYEIPGEDDRGILLLLDNGKVIGIGVDIGYKDDLAMSRDPSKHELYMYDATDTPAGEAIKKLEPGEWT